MTGQHMQDFTLYCGTLGTAFFLFKAYLVTNNKNDLALCAQIVKACDSASFHSRYSTCMCVSRYVCLMSLDETYEISISKIRNYIFLLLGLITNHFLFC